LPTPRLHRMGNSAPGCEAVRSRERTRTSGAQPCDVPRKPAGTGHPKRSAAGSQKNISRISSKYTLFFYSSLRSYDLEQARGDARRDSRTRDIAGKGTGCLLCLRTGKESSAEQMGIGPGCPGQWGSPHPWRRSKTVRMWHLGTWFSRRGGIGVTVGLDSLRGLFQPMIL